MEISKGVRPHAQVVDVELEGEETVLLHLDTKTYYTLNLTGARIWEAVKAGRNQSEIIDLLQAEFDIDAVRAEASVAALLQELHENGLIEGDD